MFFEPFASLYRDFADKLRGGSTDAPLPCAEDGPDGLRVIEAAIRSASDSGRWTSLDCV